MTPDQSVARGKKLASAGRAFITGELGPVAVSQRIRNLSRSLESEVPASIDAFDQFYKAIPLDIPLGAARLQWPIESLLEFDTKLAQVENKYRPVLLRAAHELVQLFG